MCLSLRKSKFGFLNPKESQNGFCVSFLTDQSKISRIMVRQWNRRIHSGRGFFGSFDVKWSERSWINPFRKETQKSVFSFGLKNPTMDFLKERHPKSSFNCNQRRHARSTGRAKEANTVFILRWFPQDGQTRHTQAKLSFKITLSRKKT